MSTVPCESLSLPKESHKEYNDQIIKQQLPQSNQLFQQRLPLSTKSNQQLSPCDILCRLVFQIDQREEELVVRQGCTVEGLADQLILKLSPWQKKQLCSTPEYMSLLQNELKGKLQAIMEHTHRTNNRTWKHQLQKIIHPKLATNHSEQKLTYFGHQLAHKDQQATCKELAQVACKEQGQAAAKEQAQYQRLKEVHQIINANTGGKCGNGQSRVRDYQGLKIQLYDKFLRTHSEKIMRIEINSKEKERTAIADCTFHPQLLQETCFKKDKKRRNVFDKLYNEAQQKQKRQNELSVLLQESRQLKSAECSFAPSLNSCSREIVRRKRYLEEQDEDIDEQEVTEEKINKPESSLNKFQLSKALVEVVSDEKGCALENVKKDFNIKKQSRQKKKQGAKKSFGKSKIQPKIKHKTTKFNNSQTMLVDSKQIYRQKITIQNDSYSTNTLSQRHSNCLSLTHSVLQQLPIIPTTSSTSTVHCRTEQTLPSQKMRLVFDDNRVALQQSNLLALQKSNPLHNPYRVTREHQFSKSQMLSNCRKNAIFEQIYNYLLKDEACTEVTYKKITSAYLPCEISELLQPMAQQMQQLDVGLDQDEFVWSLQRVYSGCSVYQKGLLLSWGVKLVPKSVEFVRQ